MADAVCALPIVSSMLRGITKTVWLALALALVLPAHAEQSKPPVLIGASRDQIIARYGEPKKQLKAGSREVLFFAHLKLTLKFDVVTEVEELTDEPPPKRPPPAEVPAAATAPAANPEPAPAPAANSAETPAGGKPAGAAKPAAPEPEAEPPLEIKFIRQPSAAKTPRKVPPAGPTALPTANEAAPLAPTGAASPPVAAESKVAAKSAAEPPAAPSAAPGAKAAATPVAATSPTATTPEAATAPATEESAPTIAPTEPAPTVAQKAKIAAKRSLRRRLAMDLAATEEAVSVFTAQTYALAAVVIGCVVYLVWRLKQKRLELDATTVSRTPFAMPAPDTSATFTAQMLSKLDAARFERLVAAYYAKTGVVAEQTGAPPDAAVHIKIFWKGEPKPFAGVQCHANPAGLIAAKPLQDLFAALSAAEIRRGYVVTTGKFNVEARDFAEEKHFTLLPGDLLLEKLNALPPAARGELLQETATVREPAAPAEQRAIL